MPPIPGSCRVDATNAIALWLHHTAADAIRPSDAWKRQCSLNVATNVKRDKEADRPFCLWAESLASSAVPA
ncbi:MAG: hypothetical protein EBE86_030495 [Hormoscilla sp. GUM202]|nr:hypothetical protein [Hormoscilla sp. GUM202]